MSDASKTVGRYAFESVWGTIPAVAFQDFRITGLSYNPNFERIRSAEVLDNLRRSGLVAVGESGALSVQAEMSFSTLDDFLSLMLLNDWATDTPVAGTDELVDGTTQKSMTFEAQFGGTTLYLWLTGAMLSSFDISIRRDQVVQVSMEMLGKELDGGTASQGTGGPTARLTTRPFNAVGQLTTQDEGGAPISKLDQIDVNLRRELELRYETSSQFPFEIGVGPVDIQGQLRQYFRDLALFDKAKDLTDSSLDLAWTDAAGNVMTVGVPLIQYGAPSVESPSSGSVYGTFPWEASEHVGTDRTIGFTRNPA